MVDWHGRLAGCVTAVAMTATVLVIGAAPAVGDPLIPGEWTVTLGAEGQVLPGFDGADVYTVRPYPIFGLRTLGSPAQFHSPRDGVGFALYDTNGFSAGPVGTLKSGRTASDYNALQGLDSVDWALELGGFAQYWFTPWLRSRLELEQGFFGNHGVTAQSITDVVAPVGPQWILSGGPRLTLADARALNPYFGIDAAESAASGLPIFDPKGGLRSFGAGTQAQYWWTPRWESHVYLEYDRLGADAADSPLVIQRGSPNQMTFGVGASYSFDVKLW